MVEPIDPACLYTPAWHKLPPSTFVWTNHVYGERFPAQTAQLPDRSHLELIHWKEMYAIVDSLGNAKARQRRRKDRERQCINNFTADTTVPSWGHIAIPDSQSAEVMPNELRRRYSRLTGAPDIVGKVPVSYPALLIAYNKKQ